MGKPIAGQNQFPYTVGGFLVDGAKINGITYAKKLYIYKQRSYDMYDLQDTSGNIYRFIRLGYQNTAGETLNYFDVDEELVENIPNNTFFLKIQDPSRGIFSFVRIYQWHKCITVEGDYIFRTSDIDPRLSGVLINPSISTIPVGNSLSYKTLFYPSAYPDKDGTWYVNSLDDAKDSGNISIVSSNLNTAVVKGNSIGKAVLTFVPSKNDALVTHSIVNVVQEEADVEFFEVFNINNYDSYKVGQEYTLEVVTYPYDAVVPEELNVSITEYDDGRRFKSETELVSVSPDFKKYTFRTNIIGEPNEWYPQPSVNPSFKFTMKTPIEYQYEYYNVSIESEENYKYTYDSVGTSFYFPSKLRPNMTYTAEKYVGGPNSTVYPYVSSDPSIATFDSETGIVTTYDKTGSVEFTTQYMSYDGILTETKTYNNLLVMDEVYDQIIRSPAEKTFISPGESVQYTFTGYREGYPPENIPLWDSLYPEIYTVSADGLVTVSDTAPIDSRVYVWPSKDINIDTQLLYIYRSPGTSMLVQEEGANIPMTDMYTTTDYENRTQFIRYNENGNILVYPRPNTCTSYQMEFEYYDDTVIEIIDKDFLLNNFQYAMSGTLYMFYKTLKRGSTEMIVRSVHNPEVKVTIKIIVY